MLWVAGLAASAEASLVVGGNTRPRNATGPGQDGSVSFAVFDTSGGAVGDTFGTGFAGFDAFFAAGVGSGVFDAGAAFLYLYQVVNDGTSALNIRRNTVDLNGNPSSALTSWGSFVTGGALGFFDGAAVGVGNPLGTNGVFVLSPPASAAPADASGALVGSIITALGAGTFVLPTSVDNLAGTFESNYAAGSLIGGTRSILVGFTSNLSWRYANSGVIDGVSTNGTVASLVPAPPSIVMLLTLLPFGLVGYFRRRMPLAELVN